MALVHPLANAAGLLNISSILLILHPVEACHELGLRI